MSRKEYLTSMHGFGKDLFDSFGTNRCAKRKTKYKRVGREVYYGMEERTARTRLRYIETMQRVATSLELIAFENARDLGADDTSELIEIVTRLHRFIEKVAMKTKLGAVTRQQMH